MVSEVVVGVLCAWTPLTVVSVQGMKHVFKERPLVLPASLCADNYSQLPEEAAGISETSCTQVQKESFLCDQEKIGAHGLDYDILLNKKSLTDSI